MIITKKESFMTVNLGEKLPKLKTFSEKCIVPELITKRLREKVRVQGFIKDFLNALPADIFKT